MTDLRQTTAPKSDILNADDLIGRNITVKITKVSMAAGEQPIAVNFEGDNGKPYMPCKSMRRVLVQVWGADGATYVGRSMTLYRDEKVMFGGVAVGGIRISHMSNIDKDVTLVLTASKTSRKPFTVHPLRAQTETSIADPAILEEGEMAAAQGVKAYSAWIDKLTPEIKQTVRYMHNAWTKIAKEAGE